MVHSHLAAVHQFAKQQLIGQGLADGVLNQALHWASTHQWIKTFLGQVLAQFVCEHRIHFLLVQLFFQLHQELVDHAKNDFFIQRTEGNDRIQTVAELGAEHALDVFHLIALHLGFHEADTALGQGFCTRVGGHDDDHIAEVSLATVVVGQSTVVHDLKQNIEHIGVRFFDFVEQQHAMWLFGNGLGQQAALVKANVTWGRTNQTRNSVAFHVFRHVETQHFNAENKGQLFGHLGFTHTRGAAEQERANRLVGLAQTCTRHFDGVCQSLNGGVLPKHSGFQIAIERGQLVAVIGINRLWRNTGNFRDNVFDVALRNCFTLFAFWQNTLSRTGFINHVNGLVGQMTIIDKLGRQLSGCRNGRAGVLHAMVVFKPALQTAQNFNGLFHGGFRHIDFLEAA